MRESSKSDKEGVAKNLLKQREGDIAKGIPVTPQTNRVRFEELGVDVLNDDRTNGKRSLADTERRFTLHVKPFFGRRRAAAINTAAVREYIKRQQGRQPTPRSTASWRS